MSHEIKTSQAAADEAKQVLQQGVDAFCALKLQPLSNVIPAEGSLRHDYVLVGALEKALDAYNVMINADVGMVQGVQDALAAADANAACAYA